MPSRLAFDPAMPMSAGPKLWPAIVLAVCELAFARIRHQTLDARDLPFATVDKTASAGRDPTLRGEQLARLLARLIPRVARRMPFRSDCLVQALAAQHWLARKGVSSSLHIGSRRTGKKGFEAHAWLTVGELVVTGWDIENFEQFVAFPPPRAPTTAT